MEIVQQLGAYIVGGIVIEKGFQAGGCLLREQGIWVESLAIIESLQNRQVTVIE